MQKISLIIATFNWIEALELTLISVLNQTTQPFEVIIADDGSNDETKQLIDTFRTKFEIPLVHVWHEDKGFRLAEIRNKAIVKAKGDFICQIDGDIILHPKYIEDYSRLIKPGFYYRGSRVRLTEKLATERLQNKNINFTYFTKGLMSRFNAYRNSFLNKLMSTPILESKNALGCNMGFWKSDLIKVNGYSNDLVGWGHEDEELCARLINANVLKIKIKHKAIVFHIYHIERSADAANSHDENIELVRTKKIIRTKNGMNEVS
ncbi:MAG: glycosyltransferase family 2 protein [Flavobacteriaceae bacterium]